MSRVRHVSAPTCSPDPNEQLHNLFYSGCGQYLGSSSEQHLCVSRKAGKWRFLDCSASALIKRPQVISVFIGITLSHRLNKAAVYLSITRQNIFPAIRCNPAVVVTSKLS
jgi:hypothetical protein